MKFPKVSWIFIWTLASCSSRQENNVHSDILQESPIKDTTYKSDILQFLKQDLNKKNVTVNGNYYLLTQSSDSTVKITWGNDTIERVYDEPLDFQFAERLRVAWDNKDYLILRFGVGSGAWETVTFPMNNKGQVQVFDNGLCFDTKYNLLGTQQFEDTVLAVHNLNTGKSQFIIENENPCDAASNNNCIDSISITNKILYYRWVTPYKFSEKKKSTEKRIRLKI